jgi:serine/threonine protein kinase
MYNGIDRETGNEVMWRVIEVDRVDQSKSCDLNVATFTRWMQELEHLVKLDCKHVLKYLHCERKSDSEVILVTEMITRGPLSSYIATLRHPKMSICQQWYRQILSGLQYLHDHKVTHGHLQCKHIYINSNTGELKIGDLGLVKLPDIVNDYLTYHRPVEDIHGFGLVALEIALAQRISQSKLQAIMRRLYETNSSNQRSLARLLECIEDDDYRSLVETCLQADETTSAEDILQHPFLTRPRSKDDVLRAIKRPSLRAPPRQSMGSREGREDAKVMVVRNTLRDKNVIPSHKIHVVLRTAWKDLVKTITFEYDINNDTPDILANEMRTHHIVSEASIIAIQKEIQAVGIVH